MKLKLTLLAVGLLSFSSASSQNLASSGLADSHALLEMGDRAYQAGDLTAAIHYYGRADSTETTFSTRVRLARAWNDQATELYASGRPQEAEVAAGMATEMSRWLTTLAPQEAMSWFYQAASQGTQALFAKGKAKVHLGAGIEEDCLKALEIDSTFALPHIALGIYYREIARLSRLERFVARSLFGSIPRGAATKAIVHLRRAVELAPDLRVAHFQLGRTFEAFGDGGAARIAYANALKRPAMNARDRRNETTIRGALVETIIE